MNAVAAMQEDVNGMGGEVNAESLQFLTFTVEKETYGVELTSIREIKGWSETTRLPNAPKALRGVMNLRGAVIPIYDLRVRFGLEPIQANARNVIIILSTAGRDVGILVDAVSDILDVESNQIKPPPESGATDERFVSGVIMAEERMIVLLDMLTIFKASETEAILKQHQS